LTLPVELARHHYAASTPGARIVGGLLIWLIVAAIVRAGIFAIAPSRHRGQPASPPATSRAQGWTLRYALAALIAAEVFLVAIGSLLWSVGARIPHGVGALISEATFLAVLVPLYRSGRLRAVDLGFRRAPGARSVGLVVLGFIAYGVFS